MKIAFLGMMLTTTVAFAQTTQPAMKPAAEYRSAMEAAAHAYEKAIKEANDAYLKAAEDAQEKFLRTAKGEEAQAAKEDLVNLKLKLAGKPPRDKRLAMLEVSSKQIVKIGKIEDKALIWWDWTEVWVMIPKNLAGMSGTKPKWAGPATYRAKVLLGGVVYALSYDAPDGWERIGTARRAKADGPEISVSKRSFATGEEFEVTGLSIVGNLILSDDSAK